ncbi:hypothetical protein CYMTET_31364 [Cymbomonas tetramitiformis]|uniref:Uncharacterized protein n=1 Tax=Cymbomonas tetramitiformis TaxID=36881 RepID=A0AAE0FHN3_9CHLO|nr:hypothetical protein CYMTET_43534 [Cymbomonas tetramitiformis]KAK3259650.1 hypothetical protein CYMTET_31364 [Cymbomonas tetramitiformis]|eukprot:gene23070-27915_t
MGCGVHSREQCPPDAVNTDDLQEPLRKGAQTPPPDASTKMPSSRQSQLAEKKLAWAAPDVPGPKATAAVCTVELAESQEARPLDRQESEVETVAAESSAEKRRHSALQIGTTWHHHAMSNTLSTEEPTEAGLCRSSLAVRCQFLSLCWVPFIKELAGLSQSIRARVDAGYTVDSRFPIRGRNLQMLIERSLTLTELWYGRGRGNLCRLYAWFVDAMELCGVTAYQWTAVPTHLSEDGWLQVVDGKTRSSFLQVLRGRDAERSATGSMSQKQGESAIDNTTLSNVMHPSEARRLLGVRLVRRFLMRTVQLRQQRHLRHIGAHIGLDLLLQKPKFVAMVLATLRPADLQELRIEPSNVSWRALCERGTLLTDWGQIPAQDQCAITALLNSHFRINTKAAEKEGQRRDGSACSEGAAGPVDGLGTFERFVAFCKGHPGQFFGGSRAHHTMVLVAGMWSGHVAIVRRSVLEKFTHAKYLALPWVRSVPLESDTGVVVRAVGTREFSRVRANECPYASLHAMSIAGGGSSEQMDLVYELNIPLDPAARLGNWGLTDVEKICNEAKLLNPMVARHPDGDGQAPDARGKLASGTVIVHEEDGLVSEVAEKCGTDESNGDGMTSLILPGDEGFDVGQNPKVGSSIGATQHTQIWRGGLADYPVYQLHSVAGARREPGLGGARVDIVPVGAASEDAVLVKVLCSDPAAPAIQRFLSGLKRALLGHYGGAQHCDLLVKAMGDGVGGFVVVLVPLAQLEKGNAPHGYFNPLLKAHQAQFDLAVPCIDTGKGCGVWMLNNLEHKQQCLQNGEGSVRRLYDFCRCPGAYVVIKKYLDTWRQQQ